jgi:hypothetical protein
MTTTYSGTVSSNGEKTTKRSNTVLYFLDPTICTAPSNVLISSIYAENIAYEIDEYITYNDKLYKCITAHTSTPVFDANKWNEAKEEVVTLTSVALSSFDIPFSFSMGREHCIHNMQIQTDLAYDCMNIGYITIYEQNAKFELNGQF